MSDTLFPEYPPVDKPKRRQVECCEAWVAFTDQYPDPPVVYAVVHAFAHGRVPFTIDALAERAGTTERGSRGAIAIALDRGWVTPVHPEAYMHHPVLRAWIGTLPRRR